MNNSLRSILMISFIVSLAAFGCGQQVQSSQEAIELSKTKGIVEVQVQYLVKQANSFINSDNFEDGISTAKYILSKLDSNSTEAKSIIEKAQAELRRLGEQKVKEFKSKMGNLGK